MRCATGTACSKFAARSIVCVHEAGRGVGGGGGGLLLPSAASEGCCDACGRWELQDEECVQAVLTSLEVAASDVRFAPKLADACFEDRHSFCSSVPPGSARVLGCLQEKCAAALLLIPANIFAPHASPFNAQGASTSDDVKRRKLTARQWQIMEHADMLEILSFTLCVACGFWLCSLSDSYLLGCEARFSVDQCSTKLMTDDG